ncbi:MAG TPA: hypothetical protein VFA11_15025 [Acidimicrobiales bacterium]|nr:hypothetical protein [Acidimicrobiales bacterium]
MDDGPEIAIAGCRAAASADPEDLYPDPDSELLVAALRARGRRAAMVSWDDPAVTWEAIGVVAVRSTWDSVDRPAEYLRWARHVGEVSTLVNPADVLAWNLDKVYLADLAGLGVPVVPTRFLRPGTSWALPPGEFVVKPAISAGGRDTARYGPPHAADAQSHIRRLLDRGQTVMVQPYLPAVEDPGEMSVVFIDGRFSHAVRKGPVLQAGAGVVERPWERMTYLGAATPSSAERDVAQWAAATVERRFGPLVYSRVDLIRDRTGEPLVIEVELIDPYLSLSLSPGAPATLASALDRCLVRTRSAN